MNVLVLGCGKAGAKLAGVLDRQGHDVCVVDRDAENFDRLDSDYSGYTVAGLSIDQDVLRRGGIESSDVVIAVTPDDNLNIMAAQLAHEIFHVGKVITRVYDPLRGNVFSHFNLDTVCPTTLTVDAICSMLEEDTHIKRVEFGQSTVSYHIIPVEKKQVGRELDEILSSRDSLFFGVQAADGRVILAGDRHYTLEEGDSLIYALLEA